jgi:hypothetical protein
MHDLPPGPAARVDCIITQAARLTWVALLFVTLRSAEINAQDTLPRREWRSMVGVSVGLPGHRRQTSFDLTTAAVSFTRVRPSHVGFDLSVGTAPRAIADGIGALGIRAGAVLPIPVGSGAMLLPGAGMSIVVLSANQGIAGAYGWNGSVTALLATTPSTAIRTGISLHELNAVYGFWLYEVGIAWCIGPAK